MSSPRTRQRSRWLRDGAWCSERILRDGARRNGAARNAGRRTAKRRSRAVRGERDQHGDRRSKRPTAPYSVSLQALALPARPHAAPLARRPAGAWRARIRGTTEASPDPPRASPGLLEHRPRAARRDHNRIVGSIASGFRSHEDDGSLRLRYRLRRHGRWRHRRRQFVRAPEAESGRRGCEQRAPRRDETLHALPFAP
jgi:hypothetical protein